MRVRTDTAQIFDLGLTGKESQETFTDEKYRALAGGSPQGKTLQCLVDDHWTDWLDFVETAPWLRNWTHSGLYVKPIPAIIAAAQKVDGTDLPSGRSVDEVAHYNQRKIASALYAEAVWGYGMADWLKGKHVKDDAGAKTRISPAMRTIYNLQGLTYPNSARQYTWDDKIYRGCGLLIPCEFGDLDRWLEPLWIKACEWCSGHLTVVHETV
ncbi:MAG: hypothetical protein ACI4T5_06065 [Prevotella sp.]